MTKRIQQDRFAPVPATLKHGTLFTEVESNRILVGDSADAPSSILAVTKFSATATYAIDDFVSRGGKMYVCTTVTGPGWVAGHWTETGGGAATGDLWVKTPDNLFFGDAKAFQMKTVGANWYFRLGLLDMMHIDATGRVIFGVTPQLPLAAPSQPSQAANKQYVDDQVTGAGGLANWNEVATHLLPALATQNIGDSTHVVQKIYVKDMAITGTVTGLPGAVVYANNTEIDAGTATDKTVHPAGLQHKVNGLAALGTGVAADDGKFPALDAAGLLPAPVLPWATKAQAEAGTSIVVVMNPLRVKEFLVANSAAGGTVADVGKVLMLGTGGLIAGAAIPWASAGEADAGTVADKAISPVTLSHAVLSMVAAGTGIAGDSGKLLALDVTGHIPIAVINVATGAEIIAGTADKLVDAVA